MKVALLRILFIAVEVFIQQCQSADHFFENDTSSDAQIMESHTQDPST